MPALVPERLSTVARSAPCRLTRKYRTKLSDGASEGRPRRERKPGRAATSKKWKPACTSRGNSARLIQSRPGTNPVGTVSCAELLVVMPDCEGSYWKGLLTKA